MERKELLEKLNEIIVELDERKRTKISAESHKQQYFDELAQISMPIEIEVYNSTEKRTESQREFEVKKNKYNSQEYKLKLRDIQNIDYQIKLLDIEIETLETRFKAYNITYGSDLL